MINRSLTELVTFFVSAFSSVVYSQEGIQGRVARQTVNYSAITLFTIFVIATLGISYWAAKRTRDSSTFYNAGGNITPLQNGVAITGDFMSAASFLGLTALIYGFGVDGIVFILPVIASWPIMMILMSERIRNLGKFTFIDVIFTRLDKRISRIAATIGTVAIVIFYLIGQMVAAGLLIELLFGISYIYAIFIVNILAILYVVFGGMLAANLGADCESNPVAVWRRNNGFVSIKQGRVRLQPAIGCCDKRLSKR